MPCNLDTALKHRKNDASLFLHIGQPALIQMEQYKRGGQGMDVDLIFKIAAIGIIVAVLNQLLVRSGREEQAMMTTLAGLVVVMMMLVKEISALFSLIKSLFGF